MKKIIAVLTTLLICFVFLVPQSWADMTITNKHFMTIGNKHALLCDVAFDSSYASDGEVFDYTKYGFTKVDQVWMQPTHGYTFNYGLSGDSKVKVFAPAPPIVFEESVAVSDSGGVSVGTLQYPAAFIMYVASGLTVYRVIPSIDLAGVTVPGEHQVKPNIEKGVRTTLNFGYAGVDASGVSVTYATQAWGDVYDNRFLVVVGGSGTTDSTSTSANCQSGLSGAIFEEAVAIESIYFYDASAAVGYPMVPTVKGQTTTVWGETPVDFSYAGLNGESGTSVAYLHGDSGDSIFITYIKKPSAGFLRDRFVEEDTITPTFGGMALSSGKMLSRALLYGTAGCLPADTTEWAYLARSGTTDIPFSAVTAANWAAPLSYEDTVAESSEFGASGLSGYYFRTQFRTAYGHSDSDDFGISYIWGEPSEIRTVPLEVPAGANLEGVTGIKTLVIGR